MAADTRMRFADNAVIHGCMSVPLGGEARIVYRVRSCCDAASQLGVSAASDSSKPSRNASRGRQMDTAKGWRVMMLEKLRNKMKLAVNFPSPPAVAQQIIELASDPEIDVVKIANVMSQDRK